MFLTQHLFLLNVTLLFLVVFVSSSAGHHANKSVSESVTDFNTDALFLTPYIENGQIEKAQKLAKVPRMLNMESFAGFLTVNKTCNSNLFFWLFKSQQGKWEKRPMIVWMQGNIGYSSLLGVFQIGPYVISKDLILKRSKYSWARKYNLVFIDNPVGAGFSFTDMDAGYARNATDTSTNFYEALVQLHKLFPHLQKNKLVIAGESYGTKYAIAAAYKIYKMNQVSVLKLNLSRLILSSAFLDPISTTKYGFYLYNLGLIDKTQRQILTRQEEEFRANIRAGDYPAAANLFDEEKKEIVQFTGLKRLLNFFDDMKRLNFSTRVNWFISQPQIGEALHLGSYKLTDGKEAYNHMKNDRMRSLKPLVEELLSAEAFPIMFTNGQLDVLCAYSLHLEFYYSLQWPRAKEYHEAKRCQFKVGNQVAGYFKTAGTFTEVLQRNSGHFVAASQPKWAFELIDRFIQNSTFFQCV